MADQSQQNPGGRPGGSQSQGGGRGGGGRRGRDGRDDGAADAASQSFGVRAVKRLIERAGRAGGEKLGRNSVAMRGLDWIRSQTSPAFMSAFIETAGVALPATIQAWGLEGILDRLQIKNAALAQELADEGLDEVIVGFLHGVSKIEARPEEDREKELEKLIGETVGRLQQELIINRTGRSPYEMAAVLDEPDKTRWQDMLRGLTAKENEQFIKIVNLGHKVEPAKVRGVFELYPVTVTLVGPEGATDTQIKETRTDTARPAILALLGIKEEKKEDEKKDEPADLAKKIEQIGAQVAGTVEGIKNAFEKYLPPDAERPTEGPEPVSFHDKALATRRVRRLQSGANRRQKDWLDRVLEWVFHPIRSFRRKFGF